MLYWREQGVKEMGKKHRTFSSEFKFQVVMEVLSGAKRPSEICREHQLSESVLHRWRKEFLEKGSQIFERSGAAKQDDRRIAELERMIGRLTLELSAAKKYRTGWTHCREKARYRRYTESRIFSVAVVPGLGYGAQHLLLSGNRRR